jgi:hypothetical protein
MVEERSENAGRASMVGRLRIEALASGFVPMLALILSAYTVYIQRQQLKVQAWPRLAVETDTQHGSSPDELHVTLTLKNRGVAPAEIRSVRVGYAGDDVSNWPDWLAHIARKHGVAGAVHLTKAGNPAGEILGVGEEYVLMATDSARTAALLTLDDDPNMSFCYCSVLDDCWVLDLPRGSAPVTTTPVARCPTYPTGFTAWPRDESRKWGEAILDAGAATDAAP